MTELERETCEHCYEDLAYHHHRNLRYPGGRLTILRNKIEEIQKEEAAKFYEEHYPPPGGFL